MRLGQLHTISQLTPNSVSLISDLDLEADIVLLYIIIIIITRNSDH